MPIPTPGSPHFGIVGAGCAGLALARALVRRLPSCRIDIFEPRTDFRRDRTWCGWTLPGTTDETSVTHRWTRWQVRGEGRIVQRGHPDHPYRHIPSDRYSEGVRDELLATGRVRLRMGTAVTAIETRGGGRTGGGTGGETAGDEVVVVSAEGRETFDRVFDSRPAEAGDRAAPTLLQHFRGVEVETEEACFRPDEVILMDFDVPQDEGLHFFYVLPFSPTRALVEATFITPPPAVAPAYDARIAAYLRERFGVERWRACFEEQGGIPMGLEPVEMSPHPRVWRIGVAAGVVKSSSGYAFDAIQRDSVRVADAVARGDARPGPPRSRLASVLDRIFVSYLRRHAEAGPSLFPRMFARTDPARLIRFLSDRARPLDYPMVMLSMPTLAFAAHAVRSVREWR